jgi:S-adenosylmethionine hydrolase
MARPVIALLTDFGTRDHYVGTMKAVILGICPEVTLIDVTHDIPAHDVLSGALELAASYRYFPAGTIFLVVVDPGVGSARRCIAAETADHRFVAPDNGVLTAVLTDSPARRMVELTERHMRGRPSAGPSKGVTASRPLRAGSRKASTFRRSGGRPARFSA